MNQKELPVALYFNRRKSIPSTISIEWINKSPIANLINYHDDTFSPASSWSFYRFALLDQLASGSSFCFVLIHHSIEFVYCLEHFNLPEKA